MIVTLKKIEARCDDIAQTTAPRRQSTGISGGLAWLWSLASAVWLSVRVG